MTSYKQPGQQLLTMGLTVLAAFIGCELDSAPHAEARLQSSNQMKELLLGIALYRSANEGEWPEELGDVRHFTDTSFAELMHNPITGDEPGYEYVSPPTDADPETTVILYQLRDGQRDAELRVGFASGRVSQLSQPQALPQSGVTRLDRG